MTTRISREIFLYGEITVHRRGVGISAPLCHWRRKEKLGRERGKRRGQEGRLENGETTAKRKVGAEKITLNMERDC